jgi:ABC-type multidrug transport system fused ATPase/permease subunit
VCRYKEAISKYFIYNATLSEKKPPKGWPSKGEIEFKKIVVKYGDSATPSLKGISCLIRPLEKVIILIICFRQHFPNCLLSHVRKQIGIVGRSGAGKSSFISVFFRLTEPFEGEIVIDGINILDLGLRDLRSKISIIPQDPILFLGTLRVNFDPLEEYADSEIWEMLKDIHLFEMVKELPKGLETKVYLSDASDN